MFLPRFLFLFSSKFVRLHYLALKPVHSNVGYLGGGGGLVLVARNEYEEDEDEEGEVEAMNDPGTTRIIPLRSNFIVGAAGEDEEEDEDELD